MKKLLLLIILVSSLSCSSQQPTKEEARGAFLEIIKSVMKHNYNQYLGYFNDSLKYLGLPAARRNGSSVPSTFDTLFLREDFFRDTVDLHRKMKEDFKGNFDTLYNNYIKLADIKILSKKEFPDTATLRKMDRKKFVGDEGFVLASIAFFHKYYTDNDFIVFGDATKSGESVNPMGREDWYFYVLRKTKSGWKIFAFR